MKAKTQLTQKWEQLVSNEKVYHKLLRSNRKKLSEVAAQLDACDKKKLALLEERIAEQEGK